MKKAGVLIVFLLCGCGAASKGRTGTGPPINPQVQVPLELKIERPPMKGGAAPRAVLVALRQEMVRSMARFKAMPSPKPYHLAYEVVDQHTETVSASDGALLHSSGDQKRSLDVDVRIGDYALDNTHPLQGDKGRSFSNSRNRGTLPMEDVPDLLRPTVWLITQRNYRVAREQYLKVMGNKAVKAEAEDKSEDFTREEPVKHLEPRRGLKVDRSQWEAQVRRLSAATRELPWLLESSVMLRGQVNNRVLITSDGSEVQDSRGVFSLLISATTRTEDGMDLQRSERVQVGDASKLPSDEQARALLRKVLDDLTALRKAPLAEPFTGPAIIDGPAAGVFFHEVFGHRVEGHRQRASEEGQTFAKKVGKQVTSPIISVYDDPTMRRVDGQELSGFYQVDNEGVRARRAELVRQGVLKGFLLSRAPVRGFTRSNGHGRRSSGKAVVARQGNLVVHPSRVMPADRLKARLLAEIKKQGKPYGLRFARVKGGFTFTRRQGVQSFKVRPTMVYKVFPDGREELIRGADLEGTPLTALSQILAASDRAAVFNGTCGAESGYVPVSAISPALLVARVEIARRASNKDKPPLLPPPAAPAASTGGQP